MFAYLLSDARNSSINSSISMVPISMVPNGAELCARVLVMEIAQKLVTSERRNW